MDFYNEFILDILKDKGVSLTGFADLSEVDCQARMGIRYGICIAVALKTFPSVSEEPSIEYYNEYKALNKTLKEVSFFLEEKIKAQGFEAYSLARNKQDENFATPLPFKTLATRSGLGWIGKSATLITKEYGNAVRLNGVITDMPFETGEPINESFCGECRECVENCPAKAIVGNSWSLATARNELVNPHKCKEKVIERGRTFSVRDGSCGICLAVCPWTRRYRAKLDGEWILG